MSEFDEKMQKFFEDFKEQVPIEDGTAIKVMERIKIRNNTIRRRRIFTLSIVLTLSFLIAMSSIVPVFGRNGTLPQLISGISLEKNATIFSGTIEAQSEVLNEIKAKGLSTSDSIIILALLDKTDVPVDEIIEMRLSGTGWGKIISDLGISLSTVQQTLEQASVQVKDQVRDQNQAGNGNSQSASNTLTSTVLVIKGEIQSITVQNFTVIAITVNDTPISITNQTIIRDTSKLLPIGDLKVDDEVLVHAVKDNNTITAQTIQLFNKNNQNKGNEKNFFVVNGIVTNVNITINPNTLTIDTTVVAVTSDTEIKAQGKIVDFTSINTGDKVVAKVHSSDSGNIADEITITGNNANKGNEEEENNGSEGQENKGNAQTKEYELRSTVVSFDGATLIIKDFENNIVVNQDTKVEKEDSGRVDVKAIQLNDTLQIHIRYDGDKYYATNIVILTAPEHKNETFKGEVAIIDLTNNVIFLRDNGTTFKITDSTKSNKDLTEIKLGDEVEIVGTRVDANTINIQNINVIKKGGNENPGNSENNPGQSGKH
jgi:Tfp pilus assembly protein PilZ